MNRQPAEREQPHVVTPAVVQPAHHRPPAIEYRDGVPYHYTVGQPPAPQQIVVQMPEQAGLSPEMQRLIIVTFLILAVITVCTACACAVVVLMGGTLIGIIGTVSANLPFIGVTLVAAIVAVGWAAGKVKGITGGKDETPAGKKAGRK